MSSAAMFDPPYPAAGGALHDIPFVAFDTETTGLHASDRLVELAAVRFRGDLVEGEWSTLVDPGTPIPAEATLVHGIQSRDVAGSPPAAEALPSFLDFIEGAALVGHNAPFDIRVLAHELLRAGLPLPDNPVLDTCAIPRRLRLDVPNHRLATLARRFGVPQGSGHRALADARVAGGLLEAYLRDLGPAVDSLVRRALTQDALLLSFRRYASEEVPSSPLVALMRRARAERRAVILASADDGTPPRPRRVTPRDVYSLGGTVYVEADSHEDGSVRTFRADRITVARLDQEKNSSFRPPILVPSSLVSERAMHTPFRSW
jgi:DNA polymerase III epsilon subunit family exonuclease